MEYDVNKINEELRGWDGGKYFGQWETDKIIEEYFDKNNGVCVEVGAANGIKGSNSLYFEKLGWDALCIEPNPNQIKSLKKYRKNIMTYAVSKEIGVMDLTVFEVGEKNIMSSLTSLVPDTRLVESHSHIINNTYKVPVKVETLSKILEIANYPKKIDFISIDTEGTELDVLESMDFEKYDVSLYIIENNYNDSCIEEFMNKKGYKKDKRYKINDFYIKK